MLDGTIDPPELGDEDRAFLSQAAAVAEAIEWSSDPWHALTSALKGVTGRKGKALFHPLRLALTGRDKGPEMAPLVERIGRERALVRLRAAARA